MKKRLWTERVLVVLILLTLMFIFGNSLLNVEKSIQASDAAAHAVQQIVDPQQENTGNATVNPQATTHPNLNYFIKNIRSAAHAIEFFVLGLELALLSVLYEKPKFKSIYLLFSTAVVTAVIDESLQFLNDRGPQVQDILMDIAGAAVAIVLVLVIYGLGCLLRLHVRDRIRHT